MGHRHDAKAVLPYRLLPFQGPKELVHYVIDIAEGQPRLRIADGDGKTPGDVMAEGGHYTIVVGTAPLPKEVG